MRQNFRQRTLEIRFHWKSGISGGNSASRTRVLVLAFPHVPQFKFSKIWIFKNLEIWKFEFLKIWKFEFLNFWKFDNLNFWIFENLKIWIFKNSNFQKFSAYSDKHIRNSYRSEKRTLLLNWRSSRIYGKFQAMKTHEMYITRKNKL